MVNFRIIRFEQNHYYFLGLNSSLAFSLGEGSFFTTRLVSISEDTINLAMVLILDGKSEHNAHVKEICLFGVKIYDL